MAEINIEKMAKIVAETALDSFEYQGKTIREWMKIITEQTTWIPVSERLPEDGTYLVTLERFYGGEPRINMRSFAKDLNKVDDFDFLEHKSGWYDYDSEYGYWEDTSVIAWMPLPEPYKEESEE